MDTNINKNENIGRYWSANNEKTILEPFYYLLKRSGKGFRKHLSIAFNHWLQIPEDKLSIINEIIEMLHNSSLLIDDIEDASVLRRGLPTAHKIYGIPLVLNCGNYVYFLALQKCLSLNHPRAAEIFTEQILQLHRGQGMDIFWRDTFTCPTEEEYKAMVILKTGGLFGLAIQLMQLFSEDKRDFTVLLDNLGLLFQIRDDLANLIDESYANNKTYAEDLTEGKFSYPIVSAIQRDPHDHQIVSILRQRTDELSVKQHCVSIIREKGALEDTAQLLVRIELRCLEEIGNLTPNPHLLQLLNQYNKLYRDYQPPKGGDKVKDMTLSSD